MGKTSDKLNYLNDTKKAIKSAIVNRGVSVSDDDTFRSYANKIGSIGETVEKVKFGASVDNFLGDVDENGAYSRPTKPYSVDLTGVKAVRDNGFRYRFYGDKNIRSFIARDLLKVESQAFSECFVSIGSEEFYAEFGCVELGPTTRAFETFYKAFVLTKNVNVVFNKLITVNGESVFKEMFASPVYGAKKQEFDKIFPVLETIVGSGVFAGFSEIALNDEIKSNTVKKIIGGSSIYLGTFYRYNSKTKYYFPNLTEITGHVFNATDLEIHFAAANQAAIEACDGYANKWGATNATIYFDL